MSSATGRATAMPASHPESVATRLQPASLKDAERLLRLAMVVTLATAGVSKLSTHGAFAQHYSDLFQAPGLRIHLPSLVVDAFLRLTPFLEIGIGLGLLWTPLRRYFVQAWCLFFMALEFGHYVLEQWSPVNEMIPYVLLGAVALMLPHHASWRRRDPTLTEGERGDLPG